MNAEEYFEEHHVPRHSKLIKGCGLLYQESEIPKLMEAYHQEQVKKLNIDDVSKCSVCDSPPIEVERVLDNEIVDFCLKCRKEI